MKKYILGLCIGLLLITGCDKKNNTTNETEQESSIWKEQEVSLKDELSGSIFIDSFEIKIPSWEYSESNNVKYYSGDNAIIAISLGYDDDYKNNVEKDLKDTKTISSLKQSSSKENQDAGYYTTKYTGTVTLSDKSTKDYIAYEITESSVRGYIIGIVKGNTKTEDLDEMLQEMIESITLNIMEME